MGLRSPVFPALFLSGIRGRIRCPGSACGRHCFCRCSGSAGGRITPGPCPCTAGRGISPCPCPGSACKGDGTGSSPDCRNRSGHPGESCRIILLSLCVFPQQFRYGLAAIPDLFFKQAPACLFALELGFQDPVSVLGFTELFLQKAPSVRSPANLFLSRLPGSADHLAGLPARPAYFLLRGGLCPADHFFRFLPRLSGSLGFLLRRSPGLTDLLVRLLPGLSGSRPGLLNFPVRTRLVIAYPSGSIRFRLLQFLRHLFLGGSGILELARHQHTPVLFFQQLILNAGEFPAVLLLCSLEFTFQLILLPGRAFLCFLQIFPQLVLARASHFHGAVNALFQILLLFFAVIIEKIQPHRAVLFLYTPCHQFHAE